MQTEIDKNEVTQPEDHNDGIDGILNDQNNNSDSSTASGKKKNSSWLFHFLLFIFGILLTFILLIVFLLYMVPGLQEIASVGKVKITNKSELKKDAAYNNQVGLLTKDSQRLIRKNNTFTSGQSYIVINTTDNRFSLYKNKVLIREGICSSGANKILQAEKRTYIFKTPRGKFSITGKRKNPYWHRSDWDFIEQGLPVPSKDDPSRWEGGVLGDYAMDLVDGYMIHGTLYPLLMGMPVTHGCVRLLDEDLEVVFNTLNIGSKVYIF